ncbi:MAG: hypothetical protein NTW62_01980 [Candidatus Nomurabacteria bacterium]|nr:hypothetical protein [Candidatus Nomurabacteria bacterium]
MEEVLEKKVVTKKDETMAKRTQKGFSVIRKVILKPKVALRAIALGKTKKEAEKALIRSHMHLCDKNHEKFKKSISCEFKIKLRVGFEIWKDSKPMLNIVPEKLFTYCFKKSKNRTKINGWDYIKEVKSKNPAGIEIQEVLFRNPSLIDDRFKTNGEEKVIFLLFLGTTLKSRLNKWIPALYCHNSEVKKYIFDIEEAFDSEAIAVLIESKTNFKK